MEIVEGRPAITREDDPQLIQDAFWASIKYAHRGKLRTDGPTWVKQVQDAVEAIYDSRICEEVPPDVTLPPQRPTILYMSTDQLETALVCHGLEQLAAGDEGKVARINACLRSIDAVRAAA
jgi:hypothetical protein